jgi:hydrogenase maturation factor
MGCRNVCLGYPAIVTAVDGDRVVVRSGGASIAVRRLGAPDVGVGEWMLVAAGRVVRSLDARQAAELARLLRPEARTSTRRATDDDA